MKTWQSDLRMKVGIISKVKNEVHRRRLVSVLRGLAAEVEELVDHKHTRVLTEWPEMPSKYFAACIGVSYETGKRLHKQWHIDAKKAAPRGTRASAGEQAYWLGIVAKETAPK
jgi:hypothetical protein